MSRCGIARCDLWLGRFSEAAASLDACLLDVGLLGTAVRVNLAVALFFSGDVQRAAAVARQSVDERLTAAPAEQVSVCAGACWCFDC